VTALALVYVGAKQIVAGELSIGALVAGTILSARTLAPMRHVFTAWHQLRQVRETLAHIESMLGAPEEAEGGLLDKAALPQQRLAVENVTFRYAPDGAPAVEKVSFEATSGTILGIAGPPGSGKSTLVRLLLGLEKSESGRVLVDGHDVSSMSPAAWRGQAGVVPQEVQLFAGTVAENIGIGIANCPLSRIIAAAKFAGLHDHIRRLPEGYDTPLGLRGSGLSMGQRQLVAVARALVRNPRVLILDEATSALDAASEQQLLANLRRAGSGRIVILVTHRIAALEACDHVLLLRNGRMAHAGPPPEVLARVARPAANTARAVS
jgi:ABC-type bacteriocin/lantibiotic exporter with double-glycine peptidase domain